MTVEQQWGMLEAEAARGDGWRMQLARPLKGHPLFVAVEGSRRVLLLRVPTEAIPPRQHWPVCTGLEVLAVQISGHAHLGVALREPRFGDVFSALAEDLARRVEQESGESASLVGVLIGQLARWQRFLAASATGLEADAQRGLWAELQCLDTLLIPFFGAEAVIAWKGPEGAHQDFQFASAWIEVKTTLAKQPQSVRITSERQLDDTHGPPLFLHVLALEAHPEGADTLPTRVAALRVALASASSARERFEDLLLAAGYLDRDAPRYATPGYVVRRADSFRVAPGFPRIIETQLTNGVGDVAYALDLAACAPFSVPPDAFLLASAAPPSTHPNA